MTDGHDRKALRRSVFAAVIVAVGLTRLSYLIGIFKALNILYSEALADAWVQRPNLNRIFGGQTPLAHDQKQASGNAGGAPTSRCTAGQHVSLAATRLVRRNDTHRLIPSKY